MHKLSHTGEKKHVCAECGKSFSIRSNLTVHMRVHTGETPYHCSLCPKKFYDSNGLKRHRLVHERRDEKVEEEHVATLHSDGNEFSGSLLMTHSLSSLEDGVIIATDGTQYEVELPGDCATTITEYKV